MEIRTIPPETSRCTDQRESEWCICSPFCKNVGLWRSILRGQVEIKGRILPGWVTKRRPRPTWRQGVKNGKPSESAGVFQSLKALRDFRVNGAGRPGRQATRTHDVQTPEHVGILHANAGSAVTSYIEWPSESPALALRNRTVMRIDVCDQVSSDEQLEITGGHGGTRIHRAVVQCLRIGQHNDHFLSALSESTFYRLRHMDFVAPLLSADEITVECIHNWIAAGFLLGIAGRQKTKTSRSAASSRLPSSDVPCTLMCSTVTGRAPGTT